MEELKKLVEDALYADAGGEGDVESWSPIEGEPATYGVELKSGELFFIQIMEA